MNQDLEEVLGQIRKTVEVLDLAHLHEVFETVLSHPQDCLYLEDRHLTLDGLGVMHQDASEQAIPSLSFTELVERYQERRNVVMVHCRGIRAALPEAQSPGTGPWQL